MSRILFLDFDGVLNSSQFLQRNPDAYIGTVDQIDEEAVRRLNPICLTAGAEIVVSSTWRFHHDLDALRAILYIRGLDRGIAVRDTTPQLSSFDVRRGDEIRTWLNQRNEVIEGVACIDDDVDFGGLRPWLIHTNFTEGLQDHHIDEAISMLRSPPPG